MALLHRSILLTQVSVKLPASLGKCALKVTGIPIPPSPSMGAFVWRGWTQRARCCVTVGRHAECDHSCPDERHRLVAKWSVRSCDPPISLGAPVPGRPVKAPPPSHSRDHT